MALVQSADLFAVLFSELDLPDDSDVPEVVLALLPFSADEDEADSDLPVVSGLDVSDFEDSDLDESAWAESALAASPFGFDA